MSKIDSRKLRQALGQFATGVTIVTTAGENEEPIGITANSFNSVSLDPPMVLWSLSKDAYSKSAFCSAEYFCVHVLTSTQRELSERFARASEDKFADLEWSKGLGAAPLLHEYVAQFECRTTNQYPVGDHIVFVGEVVRFAKTNKRPLVFHGGAYAHAERRMMSELAKAVGEKKPFPGDRRTATRRGDNSEV